MIKVIQATLLVLGLMFGAVNLTSTAFSQEQQQRPPVVHLPIMVECGPTEYFMNNVIVKYNEVPFGKMHVSFMTPQGAWLQGVGTMYVNPEVGSWSLVVDFPDSLTNSCYFLGGTDFGPATGDY